MKIITAILGLLVLSLPLICLAHPGHGETDGFTIIHYFKEPVHVSVFLVALTGTVFFIRYLFRNRQRHENS
ncbi:MAG: hypothetical protein ABI760_24215 [Ferruginibacter sp.]